MNKWFYYFKSKRLKFICVCNPFKINDLQGRDKLSLDFAKNNFILIVEFKMMRDNKMILFEKAWEVVR